MHYFCKIKKVLRAGGGDNLSSGGWELRPQAPLQSQDQNLCTHKVGKNVGEILLLFVGAPHAW